MTSRELKESNLRDASADHGLASRCITSLPSSLGGAPLLSRMTPNAGRAFPYPQRFTTAATIVGEVVRTSVSNLLSFSFCLRESSIGSVTHRPYPGCGSFFVPYGGGARSTAERNFSFHLPFLHDPVARVKLDRVPTVGLGFYPLATLLERNLQAFIIPTHDDG